MKSLILNKNLTKIFTAIVVFAFFIIPTNEVLALPNTEDCEKALLPGGGIGVGTAGGGLGSNVPVAESGAVKKLIEKIQKDTCRQREKDVEAKGIQVGPFRQSLSWDALAWQVAKLALEKMTDSMVDWINSGFEGGPAFATDPESFFLEIGDRAAGAFLKKVGAGNLCSPFKNEVRFAVQHAYNLSTQHLRDSSQSFGECSLSQVVDNIDSFISGDFGRGGWGAWYHLTQSGQNNPYGAFLDTQFTLFSRVSAAQKQERTLLDWSHGFISSRDCEEYESDTNNPDPKCIKYGPVKTPGIIIQDKLSEALGSEIRQLELADELDEVASALVGQLTKKIFNFGSGLFSGSGEKYTSGGISVIDQRPVHENFPVTTTPPTTPPPPPPPPPPTDDVIFYFLNPIYCVALGSPPDSVQQGDDYFAIDTATGEQLTASITGTVDTSTLGEYTLIYTVISPTTGSIHTVARSVMVTVDGNCFNFS